METSKNNNNVERSYCQIVCKNRSQFTSVSSGFALLFVSGLHIAWGIWRLEIFLNSSVVIFTIMSWHIFAIVGGIIGAALVVHKRKKWMYYIGAIILAISGILFILGYNDHIAIAAARCLAGLAHGIVYNGIITHAAENVVKDIRGTLMSAINCIMFAGVFVSATIIAALTNQDSGAFTSDRAIGTITLVFALLGILCTIFLAHESVPFLLKKGEDAEAVANMLKLRNESVMTMHTAKDLEEMRLMVSQDKQSNQNIFSDGNSSVSGKMILLRIMSNLTNNYLLNIVLLILTTTILEIRYQEMAAAILTGTRFAGSLFPVISTYFISRKVHLIGFGLVASILILILAIIVTTVNILTPTTYWIAPALSIVFQLFVSVGIDPMQQVLISEAFSTSKKGWTIAYVTTAEHLVQILFIGVYFIGQITYLSITILLFVTAGIMLLFLLFFQMGLPETFRTTLKEARDLYANY